MNPKSAKDNAADLHDSTDWLTTPLPSLAAVDAALRCQVCKDLYTTPMITSCSHTFCSLCIRRSLTHDGKCPMCRANDQEMKLRQNWAVGELVEAFKKARPEIYEFATRPMTRGDSPKRKLKEVEDVTSPVQKRTRSGRRIQSHSQVVVLNSSDVDEEDLVPRDEEPADGLVPCPICQDRMTVEAVQAHIDSCDGTPSSKKRPVSNLKIPVVRPERLPHPHYSGLKDTALRKKLADQGITSSGSRQLMERRYTEWVTLWNANCDAKSPKGKTELKRELDIWERTQGGKANTVGKEHIVGAQIKDKDFDGKAWAVKNDEAFRDLIAKARKKSTAKAFAKSTSTPENTAEWSIQRDQPSPLGEEVGGAQTQVQGDERRDLPPDAPTIINSSPYQSPPILEVDNIVNPDIASIKPLQQ